MSDSEELILLGGGVEPGYLLIDEEGVRNPDLLDVVCSNHQLTNISLNIIRLIIDDINLRVGFSISLYTLPLLIMIL